MTQNLFKTHPIGSQKTGFTLVETLVAITVLLLVIIGPMTVAQKGVQNAYFANEQTTAVFLAQEGLESIRALRDNTALRAWSGESVTTANWVSAIDVVSCRPNSGDKCGYDPESGEIKNCDQLNGCALYLAPNGRYTHDNSNGAVATPFTRSVSVSSGADAANVKVVVEWDSQVLNNRSVILETWIYDQYKRYSN